MTFRSPTARRGITTVEFAFTAPILFLLVFGAIEFTRANQLLHTAGIAATEGARTGIIAGATADDVEQAIATELALVGITNADVLVSPSTITSDTDVVTAGVTVPVDATNGYLTPRFFLGKNVTKVVSMTREAKKTDKNAGKAKSQESDVRNGLKNGQGKKVGSSNNSSGS